MLCLEPQGVQAEDEIKIKTPVLVSADDSDTNKTIKTWQG